MGAPFLAAFARNGAFDFEFDRVGNCSRTDYAALPICGWAQCEHRRASIGISLRHSVHFLVVGSAGAGSFRIRATSAFTGVTTKK